MKKIILKVYILLFINIIINSCTDKLDIKKDYDFDVSHLPYQTEALLNENVEIRTFIVREGKYESAIYTIRYFQRSGIGTLMLYDDRILTVNDMFMLTNNTFRMYYMPLTTGNHAWDVWIEDNFGQAVHKEFAINAR